MIKGRRARYVRVGSWLESFSQNLGYFGRKQSMDLPIM
jgi:hypothetical protein